MLVTQSFWTGDVRKHTAGWLPPYLNGFLEGMVAPLQRLTFFTFLICVLLSACGPQNAPQGDVYFQDDFSNPSSGWDRADGADGITDYSDGTYRIFSATINYYMWATSGKAYPPDVRIEVDVVKESGPDPDVFGILCRYQDVRSFYILMISGDGQAGIAKRTSANDLIMLSADSLESNSSIHRGLAGNHLRADCTGTSLALYVNQTLVATATDADFTSGDAGLWLGAFDHPGTDLSFDNFIVRKP